LPGVPLRPAILTFSWLQSDIFVVVLGRFRGESDIFVVAAYALSTAPRR
jgi:hypothetical protein